MIQLKFWDHVLFRLFCIFLWLFAPCLPLFRHSLSAHKSIECAYFQLMLTIKLCTLFWIEKVSRTLLIRISVVPLTFWINWGKVQFSYFPCITYKFALFHVMRIAIGNGTKMECRTLYTISPVRRFRYQRDGRQLRLKGTNCRG